jgi:hypothetical protein
MKIFGSIFPEDFKNFGIDFFGNDDFNKNFKGKFLSYMYKILEIFIFSEKFLLEFFNDFTYSSNFNFNFNNLNCFKIACVILAISRKYLFMSLKNFGFDFLINKTKINTNTNNDNDYHTNNNPNNDKDNDNHTFINKIFEINNAIDTANSYKEKIELTNNNNDNDIEIKDFIWNKKLEEIYEIKFSDFEEEFKICERYLLYINKILFIYKKNIFFLFYFIKYFYL